jgi:class 3 adenylate cyclase/tetratricopeptide (TPR) repeat protein
VPVAERRVCSVLFCDLVGFTPLSESRDPEEVRELLSRYFDAARTVIERYGGTVEKFIGDAVMAVWGVPTATEGDAERAVRAALDVVAAVGELGREAHVPGLGARGGVVTGEVAATTGAVGQGMVAGDAVNTAARVQAAAEPGTVLVDEGTWRVANQAVTFRPAGKFTLKGKAEPVALWRAERVVSGIGGSQRIDGLEAPLLGRDVELRLVKELFHASAERSAPRLLSVTGPAGVGKSRLGWEFEKYIDGLAAVVRWHRGRCLSYGEGVAFWALTEMVRQRLGIAEEDEPAVVEARLDAGLEQWVRDPATRGYIRPRLARLVGAPAGAAPGAGSGGSGGSGAELPREELFAGWRLFFEQLAASAPVVLLVEDLQHADSGLLDFLEHLLDWARDVPIFVLTLARPELEQRRPGWGSGRRNRTALTLDPLDPASTSALLDALVPGMPEQARTVIAAQAQGIPLYAVETIRMLVDRDVVQPIDGVYRLIGDVGDLAVPATLHSLLLARIDALPPDARQLVADAAVLGGTFPAEALAGISGRDVAEVRPLLEDLVRREVFAVRADPLSPQRGQYAFVQTLLRQVAYETLSRRERKARHLAVAEHLARVFPDGGQEVSEVIAQHLVDALTAVPDDPDTPVLRERAVAALERAGERSERTGAPAAAGRAHIQAATLLEEAGGPDAALRAAAIYERAGEALLVAVDIETAEARWRRAGELYARHDRSRDQARAELGVGRSLRRSGRFDDARLALSAAVAVLEQDPDVDTVRALAELANLEATLGTPEGGPLLQRALNEAEAIDIPDDLLGYLFSLRGIYESFGDHQRQAVAFLREAVVCSERSGDSAQLARALTNVASVLMCTDPMRAAEPAKEAVTHARRIGDRWILPVCLANLLEAQVLVGEWQDADATAREITDDFLGTGATIQSAFILPVGFQAVFQALRGRTDEARRLIQVLEDGPPSKDPQNLMNIAMARAFAAATVGDAAAARAPSREALTHITALGIGSDLSCWIWPLAADVALALGDLDQTEELLRLLDQHPVGHLPALLRAERRRVTGRLLAARQDPSAVEEHRRAAEAFRNVGSPYHLAVGLLDLASAAQAAGENQEAAIAAAEAQSIACRLGAMPLRRRIEVVLEDLDQLVVEASG